MLVTKLDHGVIGGVAKKLLGSYLEKNYICLMTLTRVSCMLRLECQQDAFLGHCCFYANGLCNMSTCLKRFISDM